MKTQFYLLDINEDRSQSRPSVRLWGIDGKGKRILITANQILPYFFVLADSDDSETLRKRLLEEKKRFPHIDDVTIESRRLLGIECKALKVNCLDSNGLTDCSKAVRKALPKARVFEDDFRLSLRYLTDWMLTPCGWHECDTEPSKVESITVDAAYNTTGIVKSIDENAVPKLRILAFSLLTVAQKGSPKPEKDPIRAIAVATNHSKPETFAGRGDDDTSLLKEFLAYVAATDPDVIVGFDVNRTDWPYLIKRCELRGVKLSVGRDRSAPHRSLYGHISVAGRTNLDLSNLADDIPEVKVKTLANTARFLKLLSADGIQTIEEMERFGFWSQEEGRKKLVQNAGTNAQVSLELAEATINFPMQLSALTGMPLDQVMAAAVGFRVDSYLIRQAHTIGELVPPRNEQPFFTYRGATVLEPETGLHDNVVVLDFTSMYPNLMVNYNLSPDTLVKAGEKLSEESVYVIPEVGHRFRKTPDGFYRVVLRNLIKQRSKIRKELEGLAEKSTRYRVLKERERAVKILTNACYGYAGWAGARWYVREVAESAAALGRETIKKTIAKAKKIGLEVIYGDTDSIFVRDDKEKIRELVAWADKELDLEIKRDKDYVRVLFTEAMKRYAGLRPDGSLDIVGLEVVRGDWSDLARNVQEEVLMKILRDKSPEEAVERVRDTIRRLKNGNVPLEDLTIRKTLTKPIEEYRVRTPHVEVAKNLIKDGWLLDVGDKVAYIITKGSGRLFEKAKPATVVKQEDVDVDYYLENQVKPAAMRILERFAVDEKQLAV
jgi:DNA polymerase I